MGPSPDPDSTPLEHERAESLQTAAPSRSVLIGRPPENRYRRIAAVIAINIAVAAILFYSFGESMPIKISATQDGVVAVVDQRELTLPRGSPKLDRVGLYLAGPRLSEIAGWPTAASWHPYDLIPLLNWALRLQAETAWGQVRINPAESGEFQDFNF